MCAWRLFGKNLLLGFLLLLAASGCRPKNEITPAFYYWKTTWQASAVSKKTFKEGDFRKLYLRLCDIGLVEGGGPPQPKDVLRIGEEVQLPEAEIIPVIFLEPPVLRTLQTAEAIQTLSGNIARFTDAYCQQQGWTVKEFQLDCDWTSRTAEVYFDLLRALKNEPFFRKKTLSVTLRGHQVKHPGKGGIPPADRCMLMAYNMGDIRTLTPESTILDVPTAKDYLQKLDAYPLPLDLALPIFRWTLWYRKGRLLGILRGVDPDALAQYSFLQQEKKGTFYRSLADTTLGGYRLQTGDLLKTESPTPEEVGAVAGFAASKISNNHFAVVFYHLDEINLSRYDTRQLEEILRYCR